MKKRLLVVDDDPAVCQSLAELLTDEGYEVMPASNGVEALELAASMPVHLVLLDLNLPKKSGWDTFEGLVRQNPQAPVIIITGQPNQLFPALASGVGALMEKPLDLPKLLLAIRSLLDEPVEARLARLAGKPSEFHYMPSHLPDLNASPHTDNAEPGAS